MKFTIAIPAFKKDFLAECINSLLAQTYRDFEIIIVNDNSPEDLDTVVQEFNCKLIKYYKNEKNSGPENVVENWNKCLAYAKGDYFILMGDDDKLEPDYLEEFEKLIQKYSDLDIFHCRSKIIDEKSNFISLTPSWPELESVYDNIWHIRFASRLHFVSDFVFKTEKLKKIDGFYSLPLAWATDAVTSYIMMGNKGIAHTNKPLLNYRKHSKTISSSGNMHLKMKAILGQKNWFKKFLTTKPTDALQLVLYTNICLGIDKSITKEKIQTIKDSFNSRLSRNLIVWLRQRKTYQISTFEIFYALALFMKTKVAEKKFDIK